MAICCGLPGTSRSCFDLKFIKFDGAGHSFRRPNERIYHSFVERHALDRYPRSDTSGVVCYNASRYEIFMAYFGRVGGRWLLFTARIGATTNFGTNTYSDSCADAHDFAFSSNANADASHVRTCVWQRGGCAPDFIFDSG